MIDQISIQFDQGFLKVINIALAIIMFGVALDIKLSQVKSILKLPKAPVIGLCIQFIALPALTMGLIYLFNPAPSIALGMILVAACPGGNLSNFLTSLSGGNTTLSVTMSAISTLLSVVMTPLNFSFWGSQHPETAILIQQIEVNPLAMFKTVLLILIIPSILGAAFGSYFSGVSQKIKTPFKYLSILFFIGVVGGALKANWEHFLNYIHMIFTIVVVTNACALALGYYSGKLFKLSHEDSKAISFEVGIQNTGFGLILIFNFFGGLGGMALGAAWWGIWHIISGLILATLWSKRKTILTNKVVIN